MKKINSSKFHQQTALKKCQKLDERQMQMIVGGMNKGELVDKVAEKTPQLTLAFIESLTIYG